jgi:hypothetical protein
MPCREVRRMALGTSIVLLFSVGVICDRASLRGFGLAYVDLMLRTPPPVTCFALPELQNADALDVHGVVGGAPLVSVRRRIAVVERAYVAVSRSPISVAQLLQRRTVDRHGDAEAPSARLAHSINERCSGIVDAASARMELAVAWHAILIPPEDRIGDP